MITTEQKQRLEEKIREAVPESMELKMGCKVHIKVNDDWLNDKMVFTLTKKETEYKDNNWSVAETSMASFDEDLFEILGRPLNLQDVLIAANIAQKYLWVNQDMGHLHYGIPPKPTQNICYDLTKDYHQQSDEFYEFLYQLLV